MQIHQIKKISGQKSKKRVGRGGKRGTYSGKGVKGQKSRAGRKMRPEWRDFLKSLPKRRGYANIGFKAQPQILNLEKINKIFKDGDLINPVSLLKSGLILREKGKKLVIKILSDGDLKKKLNFKDVKLSAGAKEKIKKAGGTIK
jgi:large subunit ribosomal protein L15